MKNKAPFSYPYALFSSKSILLSFFLIYYFNCAVSAQPINNYLIFDGANDYVSLNNLDIAGNSITLEAIINSGDLDNCSSGDCRILSKATSTSEADHYWMISTLKNNGNYILRFRLKTGGNTVTQIATNYPLSNNTWYHIAANYDGNTMNLFLDGVKIASRAKSGLVTTNPNAPTWIGGNPPSATIKPWEGAIDEVRIWNTARTEAQILANMNLELTGNEPGLQAYYQFNEGTGQTITDATGNNNTVLGSSATTDINDPVFSNGGSTRNVTINLNVFLEGAFDPSLGSMTGKLLPQGTVPQGQPFNTVPWNYQGTEGAGWLPSDYPPTTVDWVLVSLRESLLPSSEIARAATVLLEDGSISPFDITLNNSINELYIMVEHRNHLPILSSQPAIISTNTLNYDFTTSNSYVPSSGFGQKMLGSSWAMYSGNADQNALNSCDISVPDKIIWEADNGTFGVYHPGDFNLDGDLNGLDRILFSYNNGIFTAIPKSTIGPDIIPPSTPTNLDAHGPTSNSILLDWTASTDNVAVTDYEIYRDNVLVQTIVATGNPTYTDAGLMPSTTYSYYVIAKDAEGNASQSSNTDQETTSSITSVCSWGGNPNLPSDDPNPAYNGSAGRYPVSSNPIPAGFPTPLTTGLCGVGIDHTTLPDVSGMTITTDGTVIELQDINGKVNVKANNVTVRKCRITSTSLYAFQLYPGFTNLTIEDTRIRAVGNSVSTCVYLQGSATLKRVNMSGGKDVMKSNVGGLTVLDSYFSGCYRNTGAHNDVVQIRSGTTFLFKGNTMLGPWQKSTSVFITSGADAPLDGLVIEDNYLSGGGYTIYSGTGPHGNTNGFVTNNRFELDSWQYGWRTGGAATFSGNIQVPSP